jgi:poly(3-hydroxybutyrate) depolymerase
VEFYMTTMRGSFCRPTSRRSLEAGRAFRLTALLLAAACSNDDTTPPPSSEDDDSTEHEGSGSTADSSDASTPTKKDAGASTPAKVTDAGKGQDRDTGTPTRPGTDAGRTTETDAGATSTSDAGKGSQGEDAGSTSGSTGTKSAGCGKAPPGTPASSIKVGSATGSYILDLPKNYDKDKAYPLVLVWHGSGVTNTAFHDYLNMHAVIGDDAILVTPECLNGGSTWPNDMTYPDALVEYFETNYCVDPGRLFTTGHSMGGMYTAMIGCQRADKFRGDAVLAAPHNNGTCVKGNMAAMMSVGMTDFVAKYDTEFAYWAKYGGCDASKTTPVDPKTFAMGTPASSGHCDEYGGCAAATPIRVCTFAGGHEIPNWVAGAVWSFFKKL